VVHINAGIAGLASCLVLGKRVGYGKEAMPPHNLTLTLIGASLLWVALVRLQCGFRGSRGWPCGNGNGRDPNRNSCRRIELDVR